MTVDDLLPPLSDIEVTRALDGFAQAVRAAYGDRLVGLYLFGSRARGDHRPDSDADVAVVLRGEIDDLWSEKARLIDLAIDTIVDTGLQVQPWPFADRVWQGSLTKLAASARAEAKPLGSRP